MRLWQKDGFRDYRGTQEPSNPRVTKQKRPCTDCFCTCSGGVEWVTVLASAGLLPIKAGDGIRPSLANVNSKPSLPAKSSAAENGTAV
ncbi:hypothetical protein ACOMHN_047099 [Nucella lapillus]